MNTSFSLINEQLILPLSFEMPRTDTTLNDGKWMKKSSTRRHWLNCECFLIMKRLTLSLNMTKIDTTLWSQPDSQGVKKIHYTRGNGHSIDESRMFPYNETFNIDIIIRDEEIRYSALISARWEKLNLSSTMRRRNPFFSYVRM